MSITPEGYEGKTFNTWLQEILDLAQSGDYFGEDFPVSADSTFNILTSIFAAQIKDLDELVQAVADNQNRDTAEGVYLDYLAKLVGIERLPSSGSTGFLLFEGNQNTFIQAFFPVADNQNRNVLTQEDLTLNRSQCYNSVFEVVTAEDGLVYSVTVGNTTYSVTAGALDTAEDIINDLVTGIGSQPNYTATKNDDLNLVITYNTSNNLLATTNSSTLNLVSIGSLVEGVSAQVGSLDFPADTITRLKGVNINVFSVTNPFDFIEGRYRETDEELRQRISAREQATGTATKPAIETTIAQISGVTSVLVKENQTMTTNVDGVPAKSYETFVVGGSDSEIADAVWETKPAGIYTHGDIPVVVTDHNGDLQTVRFSRKEELFAHVRVSFVYSEDPDVPSSPADAEDQMRAAVVAYGEGLGEGVDFVANRFYGPLYTVNGIEVSNIEIATTPNAGDTPTWQTATIEIDATEDLIFDTTRVVLQDNTPI